MASGEQLKALLKSHADGDDDRFFSVAMQVAADEARRGHGSLAEELRTLIDCAKSKPGAGAPVPIGRPRGELANLLEASHPSARLGQMVLGEELGDQIRGDRTNARGLLLRRVRCHRLAARAREGCRRDPTRSQQLSADDRAGSLAQPRHCRDQPSKDSRSCAFPSLRRHPALRVARWVSNCAAPQDTARLGGREADPVAQPRRPRGGPELRGGRSRRRRGAEGCIDSRAASGSRSGRPGDAEGAAGNRRQARCEAKRRSRRTHGERDGPTKSVSPPRAGPWRRPG